jgi:hypothetical protein
MNIVCSALVLALGGVPLVAAAGGSLKDINAAYVQDTLKVPGTKSVRERPMGEGGMPGCSVAKQFEVRQGKQGYGVIMALCHEGPLGPGKFEATIEAERKPLKQVAEMQSGDQKLQTEEILKIRTVALQGNRNGSVFLVPMVGQALMYAPTAIALSPDKKQTLVIQSDMEAGSKALERLGELLRGVDKKAQLP